MARLRVLAFLNRHLLSARHRLGGLPGVRQLRGVQLRRLHPFAHGRPRGVPVIRHYWALFLEAHRSDVKGECLEIGSTQTIVQYGGGRVTRADALDFTRHSDEVTVVADLSRADHLASDAYDCIVIPFTMHFIFDAEAALYHAVRLLKPGGVLLVNFPCVDYYFPRGLDMGTGRPIFVFWWFTPIHVEILLRRIGLSVDQFAVQTFGNLFARVAYQMNMPAEELSAEELSHVDEGHPLLVCARVVKPREWRAERPEYRESWTPQVEPQRWNRRTGHYPEE